MTVHQVYAIIAHKRYLFLAITPFDHCQTITFFNVTALLLPTLTDDDDDDDGSKT